VVAVTLARHSQPGQLNTVLYKGVILLYRSQWSWSPRNGHRFWLSSDVHGPCLRF
jgi:hypothetical protein